MRVSAVFTDLDGTLLEPDGSLGTEAAGVAARLGQHGVRLVLLTSKTETELETWIGRLGAAAGSFENGAAIRGPWGRDVMPSALRVDLLRAALERMRAVTGLPLVALDTLSEEEASRASGLPHDALPAALSRAYDLPFLAPPGAESALAAAASEVPSVSLTRGGRFWHLSGRHDKSDAFRALMSRLGLARPVVGLGDAPNDAAFLALCDCAVVVPPPGVGLSPLAALLPGARMAPSPGGVGWAAAVESILGEN